MQNDIYLDSLAYFAKTISELGLTLSDNKTETRETLYSSNSYKANGDLGKRVPVARLVTRSKVFRTSATEYKKIEYYAIEFTYFEISEAGAAIVQYQSTTNKYQAIHDYSALRITPASIEHIKKEAGITLDKYKRPSGQGSRAYIPAQLIEHIEAGAAIDHLYITEGEKKAITASRAGAWCIAISGINNYKVSKQRIENGELESSELGRIYPELRAIISASKATQITLIHDADARGLISAKGKYEPMRPRKFYNAQRRFFKALERERETLSNVKATHYAIITHDHAKGLDDLINAAPSNFRDFIQSTPAHQRPRIRQKLGIFNIENYVNTYRDTLRAHPDHSKNFRFYATKYSYKHSNKYVADAITPAEIQNAKELNIIAPAGSGKSSFFLMRGGYGDIRQCIIVAPKNSIIDNLAARFDVALWRAGTKDIREVRERKHIATNLQNITDLIATLDAQNIDVNRYTLIFDEVHTSSAQYLVKAYREAFKHLERFSQVFTLTATPAPIPNFRLNSAKNIYIDAKQLNIKYKFLECDHILKTAAARAKKDISAARAFPVILLNSKKDDARRGQLKALLSDAARLAYLDSDNKSARAYTEIVNKSNIPTDLNALITTTVLGEGVDINNTENYNLYLCSALHPSDIVQFASRFRNAKSVTLYILVSSKKKHSTADFSFFNHAQNKISEARAMIQRENYSQLTEQELKQEVSTKNKIKTFAMYATRDNIRTCAIQAFSDAREQERLTANSNLSYMRAALDSAMFRELEQETTSNKITASEKAQSKATQEQESARLVARFLAHLEMFSNADDSAIIQVCDDLTRKADRADRAAALFSVAIQCNIPRPYALELFRDAAREKLNETAIKQAAKRFKIFALLNNEQYTDRQRALVHISHDLHATLKHHESYTREAITSTINTALKEYLSITLLSDARALNAAALFLCLSANGRQTINKQKHTIYKVSHLSQLLKAHQQTNEIEITSNKPAPALDYPASYPASWDTPAPAPAPVLAWTPARAASIEKQVLRDFK